MNRNRRILRVVRILAWIYASYLVVTLIFFSINPIDATRFFPLVWRNGISPMITQLLFISIFLIVQFAALTWFLSRGRNYTIYPNEYEVTFDDVRGQEAAVRSTREVLGLFQGFKRFRESGGYPPHGLLFEGPPGTGKTLLAKAIAGEAKVPFMYASGTSFTSMWMGVGNLRVAAIFRKSRRMSDKYGGCVIFLDELDALGASRGGVQAARAPEAEGGFVHKIIMGGMGGGGGMMVNELLVQMDGLVTPKGFIWRHIRRILRVSRRRKMPQYNILIVGATNRAQTLDAALLRPGRFDRKIHVGLPDKEGRRDIIEYYLAKVRHEWIDTEKLARMTVKYSPARLKNIINEALIFGLQDGRDALNWNDLWHAKLTEEIGLKQPVRYTPREKEMTAVHEAGHAVASYTLERGESEIQVISIIKREGALGLVHGMPLEETFSRSRDQILARIKVSLAGMAAEEIWFGQTSTGPSSDLINATLNAIGMVGHLGMGKNLASYALLTDLAGNPSGMSAVLGNSDLRNEVNEILNRCKADVTTLLREKSHVVEGIRDTLLQREELVGDEIERLMIALGEEPQDQPAGVPVGAGLVPPPTGNGPVSGNGPPGPGGLPPPPPPSAPSPLSAPNEFRTY